MDSTGDQGILTLIERLEAATAPDIRLDVEIAIALPSRWPLRPSNVPGKYVTTYENGRTGVACAPDYTRSIDDAARIVPEGFAWQCGCDIDLTPTARVWGQDIHADEFAATPAIALCIAALKARIAMSASAVKDHQS